jgi:hypothetical protein
MAEAGWKLDCEILEFFTFSILYFQPYCYIYIFLGCTIISEKSSGDLFGFFWGKAVAQDDLEIMILLPQPNEMIASSLS